MMNDISLQIKKGELKDGDPILSIHDLVQSYGISKNSVEKGLQELCHRGELSKVHGKGHFAKTSPIQTQGLEQHSPSGITQLGLVYPTHSGTISLLAQVRSYAMERGALITAYDVSQKGQGLNDEKQFLESMAAVGVSGLAIFASPQQPTNRELYAQLRQQGIKVVLLAPYDYNMNDEVFLFPDYRQTGRHAVQSLSEDGCEHIFLSHISPRPIYKDWLKEGMFTECLRQGLKLHSEDFKLKTIKTRSHERLEQAVERNLSLIPELEQLPQKSGIVVRTPADAEVLRQLCLKSKEQSIDLKFFSLESKDPYPVPKVPSSACQHEDILKAAIDLLLDPQISPQQQFHRMFSPTFAR